MSVFAWLPIIVVVCSLSITFIWFFFWFLPKTQYEEHISKGMSFKQVHIRIINYYAILLFILWFLYGAIWIMING